MSNSTLKIGQATTKQRKNEHITCPNSENGEIQLYDLSGRKVSKVRNGEIYIMNGRKVMFNK